VAELEVTAMSKNAITVLPKTSGALARATNKPKPAAVGLALINDILDADVVQALSDAKQMTEVVQEAPTVCYYDGRIGETWLDNARPLHARWLKAALRAETAADLLYDVAFPRSPITPAEAGAMLRYLFAAKGKKRGDEARAKLASCIEIFSDRSNALGEATGLWKSVPRHRLVLALAIKQLMAKALYEPEECELREALATVKQRLSTLGRWASEWRQRLKCVDQTVFRFDRPAWDAAYAAVDSNVVLAMGAWEDDDDEPRNEALEALWERKQAAEALAEQTNKPARAETNQATIAACAKPAAKKTKKLANA
jgi:hypothetical protein